MCCEFNIFTDCNVLILLPKMGWTRLLKRRYGMFQENFLYTIISRPVPLCG